MKLSCDEADSKTIGTFGVFGIFASIAIAIAVANSAAVFGSALLAFWLSASPIATKRTSTEAAVAMSDLRRENILIIPYQTGTATWQSDCHSSSGRLGVMLTSLVGTFETCPPILRMSVHRGRPEVAMVRSNRRE